MSVSSMTAQICLAAAILLSVDRDVVTTQGALFSEGPRLVVGPGSGQIALEDINGDGHVDVVTRHLLQKRVGVFFGNGRGFFNSAPNSPIELAYQPGQIAVVDVNDDRVPDLVSTVSERDAVDVLLGNGAGQFTRTSGSPFAIGPSQQFYTRGLQITDIDDDKRPDILMFNGRNNGLGMIFGTGSGQFLRPSVVYGQANVNRGRHTFAVADVDADGHVDVVTASWTNGPEPGRLALRLGDGHGRFTEGHALPPIAPGPHFVVLADLNRDSRLDIATSHSGSGMLSVLLNEGGGRFEAPAGPPRQIGDEAFEFAVVDVDRDGKPDLVAVTGYSAVVLLGDGRGGFTRLPGPGFRTGPGAYHLSARDIDEDGKIDFVTSSFEGSWASVFLGR